MFVSERGEYRGLLLFLASYIEEFCGIVVFGKFSCGTYVIVVLNSDIVVFLNMRTFCYWLGADDGTLKGEDSYNC